MPIMWKCPGNPRCKKTYLYVSGMKAHIPSCRYAQKKAVRQKKEELETMLSIIQFVEDQQKGNVTLARKHALSFRWETPIFTRSSEQVSDWNRSTMARLRTKRPVTRPEVTASPH